MAVSDDSARDARAESFMELGRMTAVVAHEIRNPLAGVSGALQVIGDRLPSTAVEAAVFEEVQERLGALNRLVEQLLVLARLDSPARAPAPLTAILRDAPEFAGRALGQAAPVVETAGPIGDVVLAGDSGMLVTLFGFVLAVAVDGQGPRPEPPVDEIGSRRRVVPVAVELESSVCRVGVACGPPLAVDELARAFEPFATLDGRRIGLALVIARRIARLHGGDLALDSDDRTTAARLRLPRY